jgi:hypothetical protein
MQIFVKKLNGEYITIDVDPDDTIANLLWRLQGKKGVMLEQRLAFQGKVLDESGTIASSGIQKESTLHLGYFRRRQLPRFLAVPPEAVISSSSSRMVVEDEKNKKSEDGGVNEEEKNDNDAGGINRVTNRIRGEYRRWVEAQQQDRSSTSELPSAPPTDLEPELGACTLLTSLEEATRTRTLRFIMEGSPASPYADGKFEVVLWFCPDYPFKPFSIQMVTPIYHPLIGFPEFIQPPQPQLQQSESKPGSEGTTENAKPVIDWGPKAVRGAMLLTSKHDPVLADDTWSPAKSSLDARRVLRWMLANPVWDEFDLHDFPSAYQEYYRDWLTNKASSISTRRGISLSSTPCAVGRLRRHRYCTREFKIDVIRLLLVRLPVPCELVMHIIGQMWILYQ